MNVEAEIIEPSNAVALRDKSEALAPVEQKQAMTPAQAKIDAVASLTMKAYDRASQLVLSDEEIAALKADFPDEAFLPGAAGKENLLYIQHSCLRDRLNQVFRPGQWAIVPRNRWAEPFKTLNGKEASRVYVEAMLIIRGCFVAEAVGEMEYFPHNASQNYGDAVEGGKTAALRRCCKELGIGLQAWRKDWCDGWWQRRKAPKTPVSPRFNSNAPTPTETIKTPQKPVSVPIQATPEQKAKLISTIEAEGPDAVQKALGYFIEAGALLPTEHLSDLPLNWVPATAAQFRELGLLIAKLNDTGVVEKPAWTKLGGNQSEIQGNPATAFNADETEENPFNESEQPKKVEQPELVANDETWKVFPVPFGKHAGVTLGKLPKNTLYGFAINFKVETEFRGKPVAPEKLARDRAFRANLDQAKIHYGFEDPKI